MGRVTTLLDRSSRRRPYRLAFYSVLGAAGCVLLYDPTRQMREASIEYFRIGWGVCFILGGLLTVWGSLKDRWKSELIGIPLLWLTTLSIIAVLVAGGGTTARIAFSLFLLDLVIVMTSRWFDLAHLARAESHMLRSEGEGDGTG